MARLTYTSAERRRINEARSLKDTSVKISFRELPYSQRSFVQPSLFPEHPANVEPSEPMTPTRYISVLEAARMLWGRASVADQERSTERVLTQRLLGLYGLPPATVVPTGKGWKVDTNRIDEYITNLVAQNEAFAAAEAAWLASGAKAKTTRYVRDSLVVTVSRKALYFVTNCAYCNAVGTNEKDPRGETWHMDHVDPLNSGGLDNPCNIVKACAKCNLKKGHKVMTPRPGSHYAADSEKVGDDMLLARRRPRLNPSVRTNAQTVAA